MKGYSIAMVAACPFPANYGTPGAIRELSQSLAGLGHDVHIVTYPFGEDLPVEGIRVWRPRYWRRPSSFHAGPSMEKLLLDFLVLIKLCRVIRRERITIIHAHNYESALIAFAARLLTGRPLVYNAVSLMCDELHTYRFLPAAPARLLARFLDWTITKIPDHFVCVTKDLCDYLTRRGTPLSRIAYVPCGIRTEMFEHSDPRPLRQYYGIGERPVIMYTGINSPFQRTDYLLRAFALTLAEEPAAVLMMVSPLQRDPDLPANRALAASLGIDGNVIFVEGQKLSDLPDYLAMAAVAVLPRPDVPGHPIKLLNYMAAGRPIVCFAGAAKGVHHLHDSYLVPDHDWREFGRAMVTLLRNRQLADRLGAEAKQTVARDFDLVQLCRNIEVVYESLTGELLRSPEAPPLPSEAETPGQ
jgi:1,2-diacylglycerol 3-alpha-glucosyltransferase